MTEENVEHLLLCTPLCEPSKFTQVSITIVYLLLNILKSKQKRMGGGIFSWVEENTIQKCGALVLSDGEGSLFHMHSP